MLQRLIQPQLAKRLSASPAAALLGPRQCGKTTLAKSFGGRYFDLQQEADRYRLNAQWDMLVPLDDLLILDEAQSWPAVFPRLRGAIDADRKRNGRFLLLGSVSPALMTAVSESLAGRLALLELSPFLSPELPQDKQEQLWFYGGYPDGGILDPAAYPLWQTDYAATLAQRDLPLWGLPSLPQTTDRFFRMLSAVHGQSWNATQIGQSMGLNYKTVNSYLDYLVGAYLIRRLPPYHANIKKRLVKVPKVYWRDTGLLHALWNVPTLKDLFYHPLVGASWEGFAIEQALGVLAATGQQVQPYYFRSVDQHEIDLILDFGQERWAVEIKLSSAPTVNDMDRLIHAAGLIQAQRRFMISTTTAIIEGPHAVSCNLPHLLQQLQRRSL